MITKHRLILLCTLLIGVRCAAQSIPLTGTVAIQNSQYETGERQFVKDASIRASFAKASTSDKEGRFALDLVGVEQGTLVRLTVSHASLMVVNAREMDQVVAGRNEPLRIVMADPDKLAAAQETFYRIATTSIANGYERKLWILSDTTTELTERLSRTSIELADSLGTLGDALEVLSAQRDAAMQEAQQLAERFAYVDLDDASVQYQQAYELFRRGQVDSVLLVLDKAELDQAYTSATDRKERGGELIATANNSIRQVAQSYALKSDVQRAVLDYKGSLSTLSTLQGIQEADPDVFGPVERLRVLQDLAFIQAQIAHFPEALTLVEQAEALAIATLPNGHSELRNVLRMCSDVLNTMGDVDASLMKAERAMDLSKEFGDGDPEDLRRSHTALAAVLLEAGDYRGALGHVREAIRLVTHVHEALSTEVADLNFRSGQIYFKLGELDSAKTAYEQAIQIRSKIGHANDPELATAYTGLGSVMMELDPNDAALGFNHRALEITQETFGPDHPMVMYICNDLGVGFAYLDQWDSSLFYYGRALRISQRIFGPDHQNTGSILRNRAMTYSEEERYGEALSDCKSGMALLQRNLGDAHPSLVLAYNQLGIIYHCMGLPDSAIVAYSEGIRRSIEAHGPGHIDETLLRSNLALDLTDQGRPLEALDQLRMAWENDLRTFGYESDECQHDRYEMGVAFMEVRSLDSAQVVLQEALAMARELYPRNEKKIIQAVTDLGIVALLKGDLERAAVYADNCMSLAGTTPGINGINWVLPRELMADLRFEQGRYPEAVEECRIVLRIMEDRYGAHSRDAAQARRDLGKALYEMGDRTAGRVEVDSSFAIHPLGEAAWYRYRFAMEDGDEPRALLNAATALRLGIKDAYPSTVKREEILRAVKDLATQLNERAILKEFGLE